MAERPIIYEPHPVSAERKAELKAQGYRIIDAVFAPKDALPVAQAATPQASEYTVGKGPRGRWYVKRGKEIITGPFETEADAVAAKAREV